MARQILLGQPGLVHLQVVHAPMGNLILTLSILQQLFLEHSSV